MTITTSTNADGVTITTDTDHRADIVGRLMTPITEWFASQTVGVTTDDYDARVAIPFAARSVIAGVAADFEGAGWLPRTETYSTYPTMADVFRDLTNMCPADVDADDVTRYAYSVRAELGWITSTLTAWSNYVAPLVDADAMTSWEREQDAAPTVSLVKVTPADIASRDADIARLTTELAEARANAGSYRVQAYVARNDLEAFKVRVAEVGERYARENSFCSVYDQLIEELGLERPSRTTMVEATVTVTFTVRGMVEDRDDADSLSFARYALNTSYIEEAIQGCDPFDSDLGEDQEVTSVSVHVDSFESIDE